MLGETSPVSRSSGISEDDWILGGEIGELQVNEDKTRRGESCCCLESQTAKGQTAVTLESCCGEHLG